MHFIYIRYNITNQGFIINSVHKTNIIRIVLLDIIVITCVLIIIFLLLTGNNIDGFC